MHAFLLLCAVRRLQAEQRVRALRHPGPSAPPRHASPAVRQQDTASVSWPCQESRAEQCCTTGFCSTSTGSCGGTCLLLVQDHAECSGGRAHLELGVVHQLHGAVLADDVRLPALQQAQQVLGHAVHLAHLARAVTTPSCFIQHHLLVLIYLSHQKQHSCQISNMRASCSAS